MLLTENFVVLCIWPAYFTHMGLSILWQRNIVDALKFNPEAKTQWYVIDRKYGRGVVRELVIPLLRAGSPSTDLAAGQEIHQPLFLLLPYRERLGAKRRR